MTTESTPDQVRKVAELLKASRTAFLTTTAPDGTLVSRPMAVQEVEFDGDLWFVATRDSRKVAHIGTHEDVNVTVSSNDVWVSLTGRAAVVDDDDKKREIWNAGIEAWFPNGPEADDIVLIKVDAESAEEAVQVRVDLRRRRHRQRRVEE